MSMADVMKDFNKKAKEDIVKIRSEIGEYTEIEFIIPKKKEIR